MANVILAVPLEGWVGPLDESPDPVFAQRMLGDGVAIDPTEGRLCAPCAGKVVSIHRAKHAVTIQASGGAEVLTHIGLETVAMEGAGFELHVAEGDTVKEGQLLVSFDLDHVARHARSLLTPVLITNGDDYGILRRRDPGPASVGEFLMELRPLKAAVAATAPAPVSVSVSREVVVPLTHGIHARPAARIADLAKGFTAETSLATPARKVNARSPVGMMTLGIRHGDSVTISGVGTDAEAAVAAIAALIEGGMGETMPIIDHKPPPPAAPAVSRATERDGTRTLLGVRAAPGMAIGRAVLLKSREVAIEEVGWGVLEEKRALSGALATVRRKLTEAAAGHRQREEILGAHLAILEDPDLLEQAHAAIAEGKSAAYAWRHAVRGLAEALKASGDARIAERVDDLIDLERQVIRALRGDDHGPEVDLPAEAILIAGNILPSELVALDPSRVAGLAMAEGGPTSHVAILAAAMGIPALVALGPEVHSVADGTPLVIDADAGELQIDPADKMLATARITLAERRARREAALAAAAEECRTADGTRVEVYANLGSLKDAQAAVAQGAEGCGLLRTEFLFLERESPPDEAEQHREYQAIAAALDGRPLIIRTLDIGGDKPAPYLPMPVEENPALGMRGVRVGLWKPEFMKVQLRAIARVEPLGQCRIMLPMIASLEEFRHAKRLLLEACREVGRADPPELGIMVETPAAAMTADILAAEADFLSVGTNDLSQYVLAMDRGSAELASQIDALHPAVLRLIEKAASGARSRGRWTGVCGGLASDLTAAPILIGLGVTELSATSGIIPDLKAVVRTLSIEACRRLAAEALSLDSAAAVRAIAAKAMREGALS